ncbi:MAG: TetR/AcrR family transcriptional regulator [Sporolactobacillus sp.]
MSETRDHILDVAMDLFLKDGYKGVSLNEIVHQSQISKGGIYNYFNSKEDLFLTGVQRMIIHITEERQLKLLNHEFSTLKIFIDQYIAFIFKVIEDGSVESFPNVFQLVSDALRLSPDMRAQMKMVYQDTRAMWIEEVSQAKGCGEIHSDLEIQAIANVFMTIEEGISIDLAIKLLDIQEARESMRETMLTFYKSLS